MGLARGSMIEVAGTLGSILWFTIGSGDEHRPLRVNRHQLGEWFEQLSLPPDRLPPAPRKVDAFRAASSAVNRTWRMPGALGEDDLRVTMSVREVTYNEHLIIRHLIREETDTHGRQVTSDTVAELKFYRAARSSRGRRAGTEGVIKTVPPRVQGIARDQTEQWIAAFEDGYNAMGEWLSAAAVRKVVRDTVTDLNAIPVKPSGGVYFVHHDKQKYVDALEDLVGFFGPSSSFHQLPLVDEKRQRLMLAEAFREEATRSADKLISSIVDAASRTGRISSTRYKDFFAEFEMMNRNCAEHTHKLDLDDRPARGPLRRVAAALTEVADGRPVDETDI